MITKIIGRIEKNIEEITVKIGTKHTLLGTEIEFIENGFFNEGLN